VSTPHPGPTEPSAPAAGPGSAWNPLRSRGMAALFFALWAGIGLCGFLVLLAYDKDPGRAAAAPMHWPAASRLPREPGAPLLVMLVHPHCSCTRASLEELARFQARDPRHLPTLIVLVQPASVSRAWMDTDVARSAASIPGVRVVADSAGIETARFGSWTSGQVLLYDAAGRLRFSGGITGARGHPGDNVGLSALAAADRELGMAEPVAGATVYGCPLRGPERGTFSFLGIRP